VGRLKRLKGGYVIRKSKTEDIPVVTDIATRAFSKIYDALEKIYGQELFPVLIPDRKTAKIEQITAHALNHPEWIFICEEDGKIVGVITFSLNHQLRIGTIGNNAVDPDCGLKGIGQQMYKAVLKYFKENGMDFAEVTTGMDASHEPARRAYERAGFNIRMEYVTYYRNLKDNA